jgi:hypothetical protein
MDRLLIPITFCAGLLVSQLCQAQDALTNGLVTRYPFSGSAVDQSGDGNDGAVIGYDFHYGPDRFGAAASLYLNTTSQPSSSFDGTYVVAPRNALLDFNSDFTISLWVNTPPGLGSYYVHNLLSNGPDQQVGNIAPGANFRLISGSDFGMDYIQFVADHNLGDVHAYVPRTPQTWVQFAVTRAGTNMTLFRNGSPITNAPFTAVLSNGPSLWFGRYMCPGYPTTCPSTYQLIGGLDDVRLYNRALPPAEIAQLYHYEANPLPNLSISVKTIRLSLFVELGTTNQVDECVDLKTWNPYGPPFVATNSLTFADIDVFGTQRYFRVRRIIE